ncbi:MAG: hypothetical protein LBS25_03655, partial [Candidatus Symbiothrix sp.]|nr:hypothetical protein [Candidatus Symbiothrix sp.]
MKTIKVIFLMLCLSMFLGQTQAQQLQTVYDGTGGLPTTQGWNELRFDNSMVDDAATQALLVAPNELTAVANTALQMRAPRQNDASGFPLYSQLGYALSRTGFSPSIGYTVQFRAKVVNAEDGAFSLSATGGGEGFRLVLSNNRLSEQADVFGAARQLSTADNTDGFHTYHVAVNVDGKVHVWRDNVKLGELPLQTFKLNNIFPDGGMENGVTVAEQTWVPGSSGKAGELTISNDPAHVHSGNYGLYVNKGHFTTDYIPLKPGALYDMTAWGKTINYPDGDGHWRDLNGVIQPANINDAYFIGDKGNKGWKSYERLGMEGGAAALRIAIETPTGDANDNEMALDDIFLGERIPISRIPAGAVNLFPNGDFEDPCAQYFPVGDPRNDTCMVNPNNYRYSADAYYGGQADDQGWFNGTIYSAEHNAAPFWHPFWGARVRVQYNMQTDNSEAGPRYARGKYSLRFFNCFGHNVEYGNNFSSGQNEDRGSNSNIKTVPIELATGKKHTFLFSYHFAKWGGDHLILVVKNGEKELFRKTINNSEYSNWVDVVLPFETDADNHALQILTERDGSTPGVVYLDDLFLFEGELLPDDRAYIYFGKPTGVKESNVDIEYVKISSAGAFDPSGAPMPSAAYEPKTAPL